MADKRHLKLIPTFMISVWNVYSFTRQISYPCSIVNIPYFVFNCGIFVLFLHWRPQFAIRLCTKPHWSAVSSCLLSTSYVPWTLPVTDRRLGDGDMQGTGFVSHEWELCGNLHNEFYLPMYNNQRKITKNTVQSAWEVWMGNKLDFKFITFLNHTTK